MSADVLRQAAALMRERAEAATPGPWSIVPGASNVWRFPDEGVPTVVIQGNAMTPGLKLENAEHIASWHPAMALAVADWLDFVADGRVAIDGTSRVLHPNTASDFTGSRLFLDLEQRALAVATAYLGDAA